MLGCRLRRQSNIKPTLVQRLVFAALLYKILAYSLCRLLRENEMNRALGHLCAHIG